MQSMQIGIIGFGWVGKAQYKLFPEAVVYDKNNPFYLTKDSQKPTTMADINKCDIAFICVPTPLKKGKLDCSIVQEVVKECRCPLIIIRSTLMPGTTDYLSKKYHKKIVFQPEYIGETVAHPFDPKSCSFLILGGTKESTRKVIQIYQMVYNANIKIRQVSALEAEIIKISDNRAVAFKVTQCQELYDACEAAGVDYYTIRDAVYGDDQRFNLWFTFIYPQNRGFNSKCLPKDVYGWAAWAESCGIKPKLTQAMLKINEKYIRHKKIN